MNDLRSNTGNYLNRKYNNKKECGLTVSMIIPLVLVLCSKEKTAKSLKKTVQLPVRPRILAIFLSQSKKTGNCV